MKRLQHILFQQQDAARRLVLCRLSVAVTVIIVIATWPASAFFAEHTGTLLQGTPAVFFPLQAGQFSALRYATALLVVLWGAGVGGRFVGLLATVLFAGLNFYVSRFTPELWNYNTHLNFFMAALSCVTIKPLLRNQAPDSVAEQNKRSENLSLVLAFMQLYVASIYFQAAISKLLYGGLAWFSGSTIYGFTGLMGTPLGRQLLHYPALFPIFAVAACLFELAFPLLLLFCWHRRALLAVLALGFHLGIYAVMDISFWHLWVLYPALFIWPLHKQPEPSLLGNRSAKVFLKEERDTAMQPLHDERIGDHVGQA